MAKRSFNEITWREFIKGLKKAGVEFQSSPSNHLFKLVQGKPVWHPLPRNYDENEPVTAQVVSKVLRKFGLRDREVFPDHAFIL